MDRIFGGSPLGVLIRLAVISVVLGIVMSALDISPMQFVDSLRRIAIGVWNMGFDWFGSVGRWFVAGAVIVFPVWLAMRLLGLAKGNRGDRSAGGPSPKSSPPSRDR
jgi:hypothetical protein